RTSELFAGDFGVATRRVAYEWMFRVLRVSLPFNAGRAPFDRDHALRAASLEGAGLAALEQGAKAGGVIGVGAHQGVDDGLRIGRFQPEGGGAGGETFFPGGQMGAAVVHDQQGAVKSLGRGLRRFRAQLNRFEAILHAAQATVHRALLGETPKRRAEGQADRPGRRRGDQVHLCHWRPARIILRAR
ncbi:MAG TPA: hypothetical protein PLF78_15620, partial [Caulobacter sp.]|nr:hypothetical protein [Caulobacter sp.]